MTELPLTTEEIRSRIVEIKTVRFGDVLPHPRNPKIHPTHQREAFRGVVRELGFVSVPIAYHSERTGGLTWADGHLRGSEVADYMGEVAILDIDDKEADYLLVTADPIAALAQNDAAALDSLLREVNTGSAAVMDMLAELAEGAGVIPGDWAGAFDGLPEGDKAPFQQMTFTLHDSQAERVKEAIARARGEVGEAEVNENSNGNALAHICGVYLDG
jgi:hypothetical protein